MRVRLTRAPDDRETGHATLFAALALASVVADLGTRALTGHEWNPSAGITPAVPLPPQPELGSAFPREEGPRDVVVVQVPPPGPTGSSGTWIAGPPSRVYRYLAERLVVDSVDAMRRREASAPSPTDDPAARASRP